MRADADDLTGACRLFTALECASSTPTYHRLLWAPRLPLFFGPVICTLRSHCQCVQDGFFNE